MTQKDIEDMICYWMGNRVITDRQDILDEITNVIGGEVMPHESESIYGQMIKNGRISENRCIGPDGKEHARIKVLG